MPIRQDPQECANIVNASVFDPAHLPNYTFYTPFLCNDAHYCSWAHASVWLKGFMAPFLRHPHLLGRTLLVITFDESGSQIDRQGNRILTLFLGSSVKRGYVKSRHYDHYNVLSTIEDNFSIGTLDGQDQRSSPITDVWRVAYVRSG